MAEITQETVLTQEKSAPTPVKKQIITEATSTQSAAYIVYFIAGTLEILLALRLIFKLLGASLASGFVRVIYSLTSIFVLPFEGIFRKAVSQGIETTAVLEPATLVALVMYALLAWGIVKLVQIVSGHAQTE